MKPKKDDMNSDKKYAKNLRKNLKAYKKEKEEQTNIVVERRGE